MTTVACAGSRSAKAKRTLPEGDGPVARGAARRSSQRADLEAIYRAAVAAVDPARLVAARLSRDSDRLTIDLGASRLIRPVRSLWVAGAGKASVAMARAVAEVAPEVEGVVVAPLGSDRPLWIGRIEALRGSHPIPDEASYRSTAKLLRRLASRPSSDTVLLLLSGGASALLASPPPGVRRADKSALARVLLRCGADIELMNTVRKHVSRVKGGGLLRLARPRRVVTLALSDVIGDSLSTIGSGPGLPDPTTYADALGGLKRLDAVEALPASIRRRLEAGREGRSGAPETLKPCSRGARRGQGQGLVIGSNRTALRAAAREARRRGYRVEIRSRPLAGEASQVGAAVAAALPRRAGEPICVLAGGETTVRVPRGSRGKGGRSQELAVAAMAGLAGSGWMLLAAGTDGIDGLTPAAGGFADGGSLRRAGRRRVLRALREHDSYGLLSSLGDVFVTGPTGTNVMDLVIAVCS